ncbi:hypothetical protein DY000_02003502 [Brassica cretica]|uniref:Uncharacterized protein n=1 Tax=Brassica cretica TaxID=69181 RepID=A0ABQ7C7C3_BRACR|nr:hypothetical protein DY000_02003502 [Brassica cretica]
MGRSVGGELSFAVEPGSATAVEGRSAVTLLIFSEGLRSTDVDVVEPFVNQSLNERDESNRINPIAVCNIDLLYLLLGRNIDAVRSRRRLVLEIRDERD